MIPIDYTDKYFAKEGELVHPAGYSDYGRIHVSQSDLPFDQGEMWKTFHRNIFEVFPEKFYEKKVLFIGAAFGFEVIDFRDFGVDAKGIDLNDFNMLHMNHGNILTFNTSGFDTIIGLRFLSCLTDDELITFFNNLGNTDCLFTVDDSEFYQNNPVFDWDTVSTYYNMKTLAEWQVYNPNIYSTGDARWANSALL